MDVLGESRKVESSSKMCLDCLVKLGEDARRVYVCMYYIIINIIYYYYYYY